MAAHEARADGREQQQHRRVGEGAATLALALALAHALALARALARAPALAGRLGRERAGRRLVRLEGQARVARWRRCATAAAAAARLMTARLLGGAAARRGLGARLGGEEVVQEGRLREGIEHDQLQQRAAAARLLGRLRRGGARGGGAPAATPPLAPRRNGQEVQQPSEPRGDAGLERRPLRLRRLLPEQLLEASAAARAHGIGHVGVGQHRAEALQRVGARGGEG